MLFGKNIDDIDLTSIKSLIDASASESVNLEFKRDCYGKAYAVKKELLKDISAFANTLGGILIIGIDEDQGAASSIVPLPGTDVDNELQRLESIIRSGIEPTIVGLRMRRIDVDSGSVIVIHVPRSFNPPHRVIIKNSNRFYARNSAGTHELSLSELRTLFGEQRSIEERVNTFVGERFLRIQGKDGALPLPASTGILVMHLVPLPDFGANRRIDISILESRTQSFIPIGASGYSQRINLDGFCVFRGGEVCHGYTQIFRHGSVEATTASMLVERDGKRYFKCPGLPQNFTKALSLYMIGLRELGASPPIFLQISALDIYGVSIRVKDIMAGYVPPPFNREELHLPPTIITEYREDDNYESVIAEQMDFLWNVFGFEQCIYFDENGKLI